MFKNWSYKVNTSSKEMTRDFGTSDYTCALFVEPTSNQSKHKLKR